MVDTIRDRIPTSCSRSLLVEKTLSGWTLQDISPLGNGVLLLKFRIGMVSSVLSTI